MTVPPRRIMRRVAGGTQSTSHVPAMSPVIMRQTALLTTDPTNPRVPDAARLGLLLLSLSKLGFLMPVYVLKSSGMLLSGHQRLSQAKLLGITHMPVVEIDLRPEQIAGVNILFNRATNDMGAFDTGAKVQKNLDMSTILQLAEDLPDYADHRAPFAMDCKPELLAPILTNKAHLYDKKSVNTAEAIARMGIQIPLVVSESGQIVNGIHRGFHAAESGQSHYPVVRIPDAMAEVASSFLNYLSMDFHVDEDFANLLRHGAYRRPQNNRGMVPKAMRFWANGEKVLQDKESYNPNYFAQFREIHGERLLDFGAGLGKVAPYLNTKGFTVDDFEPYRIDPDGDAGIPSPDYSRQRGQEFLTAISDPRHVYDSIFLNSVLNSVPFAKDRLMVLAIVHALAGRSATVYGTLRDLSDFNYEYQGIRQANYFTFDSEPGVRIGDVMARPKVQKFHSQVEATEMFSRFWKDIQFWPGGNVFYFRLRAAKAPSFKALAESLRFEFDLPYQDGSRMGLAEVALQSFAKRLAFPGLVKL